jgi:hypothetical protein
VRQPNKLSLPSIYKEFSNVVRERKKDFSGPFHKLYPTLRAEFAASMVFNSEVGGSINSQAG